MISYSREQPESAILISHFRNRSRDATQYASMQYELISILIY